MYATLVIEAETSTTSLYRTHNKHPIPNHNQPQTPTCSEVVVDRDDIVERQRRDVGIASTACVVAWQRRSSAGHPTYKMHEHQVQRQ
jgi:hypothetical protein